MSQQVDGPTKTFTAGAALAQHRRVILSSSVLQYAGASDYEIGTLRDASFASGDLRAVFLRSKEGTCKMVASAVITAGAKVFAAANGKIASTGGILLGEALEAAGADGDVIEVLRTHRGGFIFGGATAVAAAGSAQGDAAALSVGLNTVSAADGTKGVVLPAAAAGGEPVLVYNEHATNGLKVYPATSDDINDGSANAAITMEGKGLAMFIPLDATTWAATYVINA